MDQSVRAEKNLFIKDMSLLTIFLFATIAVFGFVLLEVLRLTNNGMVLYIILAIASITVISIVWASVEVMMHLQRSQGYIYKEDLICQRIIFEQKRALLDEK